MRRDVLEAYPAVDPERVVVVHNGIDTDTYRPDPRTDVVERLGIDPSRPSGVFVGRITRQKGLPHLLRAAASLPSGTQLVLLASAPDTPEIEAEVHALVDALRAQRGDDVIWASEMLARPDVVQVLTHATVFVCPSVYEPMGIVNLEAMACETPVVATATGGIPEVVVDGETGILVPPNEDDDRFAADLAAAIEAVLSDPARAEAMGRAGRAHAGAGFSWARIAERTWDVYQSVLS
jgi:starch synthase